MSRLYAGIEIGGTKQQIAVADETGELVKLITGKIEMPNGAADILNWIEPNLTGLLAQYPETETLGIGFGGPIETATGRVLTSVQVGGWQDFELKTWFCDRFGLPVTVVNDTVAGGYAELQKGAGRGCRNFYYTNIGTGIGGAMFIDGRTFDGIGYGGVYMGNTYVADYRANSGDVCRLEELCSGRGIEDQLRKIGAVREDSLMFEMCSGDTQKLTCAMLGRAAEQGDKTAICCIDRFAKAYGIAIANFISLFSPERVAVGGGVANLGETILAPVRKYVGEYVFISAKGRYDIVQCELMDQNVLVGAALYARDGFLTI